MTNTTNKLLALTSAILTVLVSTGCSKDKDKHDDADAAWQDPFFPAQGSASASKTIWERSAAIAAVQDGMLFPVCFDGDALNGLGRDKIERMMDGRTSNTMLMVYLNQPSNDPTNTARVATLTRTLKANGLADEDFKVVVGPNPSTLMPAEAGIRALSPKTDGDDANTVKMTLPASMTGGGGGGAAAASAAP